MIKRIVNWNQLSDEEKDQAFDGLDPKSLEKLLFSVDIINNFPLLRAVVLIGRTGKCPWCGSKGSWLREIDGTNILSMLSPEFLVHCKTTHGLDPEVIELFLRKKTPST